MEPLTHFYSPARIQEIHARIVALQVPYTPEQNAVCAFVAAHRCPCCGRFAANHTTEAPVSVGASAKA